MGAGAAATEPVGGLFRAIHTIKGMAATMGYTGVADLAHRMENLLDGLRQGRVAAGSGVFQLLFRSVDALTQGGRGSLPRGAEPVDERLFAELDAAAAKWRRGAARPPARSGARGSSRKKRAEPVPLAAGAGRDPTRRDHARRPGRRWCSGAPNRSGP